MKNIINYSIIADDPAGHIFKVTCYIPVPETSGQLVSLPAWIPGSYMIRDFAKHVVFMNAESGGSNIAIQKIDKDSWQCEVSDKPITITYWVYAWDLSVRAAHLDTTHGFFNGTSVFLRVHGCEDWLCEVEIKQPVGDIYTDWRVATTLLSKTDSLYHFGVYCAENYDELIDHPVEMGLFELVAFEACGVPHEVAITGRHLCDTDRLCRDLKVICEYHIQFFGEPAPVDRYLFLVMVLGNGYGGLEHRSSCSLVCSRIDLPNKNDKDITEQYRNFLTLCSHEYFHTWNVKRIKPAVFMPYDLQRENYTELLWVFEGFTTYYEDLSLLRAGMLTIESYLELQGQKITQLLRSGGRCFQTLTESSFDTWTKFYKQDENAINSIVSYYIKGALTALCLDIKMRCVTDNKHSLDDVMKFLWQEYGKPGKGVEEKAIQSLVNAITGHDLSEFFNKALYSTAELDLDEALSQLGIVLKKRCEESPKDKGGASSNGNNRNKPSLSIRYKSSNGMPRITHVFNHGSAHKAGLSAGDVIIAVQGLKVTSTGLDERIAQYAIGDTVLMHVFRRDELMSFKVDLQPGFENTAYLELMKDASEKEINLRDSWASGR